MTTPAMTLYTQTECADSPKVRDWLTDHGIPFVERNVTGDLAAARALLATGIFATPLVVIGDERIVGYQPAHREARLAR